MNKKYLLMILLLVIFVIPAKSNAEAVRTIDNLTFPPLKSIKMPDIEKVKLDNGITLYLLEDHELPIVNARVRLAAGSYLDPADKIGLGVITGTVIRTGGTEKRTGDQIDETLESIGASIEVSIGNTSGSASMNILSEYVDTGLVLLSDILIRPVFTQDKIDLAKTSERSGVARRNDDPWQICMREFRKIIYGKDSPYARTEEYSTINNISREDLIEFHKKYVNPENVMIAIWGDFKKNDITAKIKKYFANWPSGGAKVPPLPGVNYDFKPGVHYIEKTNTNQSSILIGHIGGLTGDPDYFPMIVMNNILGGSFSSRLFNEVRSNLGLAYSVSGQYVSNISHPGVYYNYCFTKFASTVQAINSMIGEIKRMQTDPPTEAEMRIGKDGYLNSFVFNFDDKGEVINRVMDYDYFNFPSDFLFTVKDKIEKVTAQDVIDVARKRLHPDALHIVVVGKASDFDQPLSVFGQVDTVDITIPTGEVKEEILDSQENQAKGMELLKKAAEACGGIEVFKKVKAVSSSSTVALVTPQGEFSLKSNSLTVLPDQNRATLLTPMGEILSISDGDSAWVKQGAEVAALPPDRINESKQEQFRSTIRLFQNMGNPQFKAIYVGTEDFNGKPADIIKVISLDEKMSFKLVLDAVTYLPVGKMYFGETMMGPGNITEKLSDYREISGLKIPFLQTIESEGNKVLDEKTDRFEINPVVPDGSFMKPQ